MSLIESNSDFDYPKFINNISGVDIILFGAASGGKRSLCNLIDKGINRKNVKFCDNNQKKWGKRVLGVEVVSLDSIESKSQIIIITSSVFSEIYAQLDELGFKNVYYLSELLFSNKKFLKFDNDFNDLLDILGNRCNMDDDEKFTLYSSIKRVSSLPGHMAEVGVYKGGSSKILCEEKNKKEVHLFDTFTGLPDNVTNDDLVKKGWLSDTSLESVQEYLCKYDNVYFHQGLFPGTASKVQDKLFSLVHLDTDIYHGTYDGLSFFWSRMVTGGRIIIHDYNNVDCPGVKKAVREFFKNNLHFVVDIADTQAMIIKT